MTRLCRLSASLVLAEVTAPGNSWWRLTGPVGNMMGEDASYRVLKDGGSRQTLDIFPLMYPILSSILSPGAVSDTGVKLYSKILRLF